MSEEKKPRKKRVTKAEFRRFQKALQEETNPILEEIQKRRANQKPEPEENPLAEEKDFIKNAKEYWHK